MICTFGDVTDVVWWRELDLPAATARSSARDGRDCIADPRHPEAIMSATQSREGAAYAELAGKTVFSAQRSASSSCCARVGDLIGDPKPITTR